MSLEETSRDRADSRCGFGFCYFCVYCAHHRIGDYPTDFVLSGGSAGGLGVFLHAEYLVETYFDLSKTKVVAMPSVGFFLDYNGINGSTNYSNAMEWVFYNQQTQGSMEGSSCFNKYDEENEKYECWFPQNFTPDISIPVFVLNSQYGDFF